jgi:5-deoxy-glucuronate isomerase
MKECHMKSVHLLPQDLLERKGPEEIGQRLTSVQRVEVDGTAAVVCGEDEEMVAVVLEGDLDFGCRDDAGSATSRDMIYVPRGRTLDLTSPGGAVVMCFWCPCDRETTFRHLPFAECDADPERHHTYGDPTIGSERDVWDFLDGSVDSQRMLVGQAVGARGNWTAWPPHEHTAHREETYVYFGMGDSFGVQLVYEEHDDGMDAPLNVALVRDGHLVSVPGGYHPSVGAPAGGIQYVYFMASHVKEERNFMDLTIQAVYGDKFN